MGVKGEMSISYKRRKGYNYTVIKNRENYFIVSKNNKRVQGHVWDNREDAQRYLENILCNDTEETYKSPIKNKRPRESFI